MKTQHIIFVLLFAFSQTLLSQSTTILNDPYSIKKINVNLTAYYSHLDKVGLRPSISFYPLNRLMVNYTGYYGIPLGNYNVEYDFYLHSKEKPYNFQIHEINADLHLLDIIKRKNIHVNLVTFRERTTFSGEREVTYVTKIPSKVRKILAINAGFLIHRNIESINPDKFDLFDIANNKTLKAGTYNKSIVANINYRNLSIGLKYKSVNGTGIDHEKYGKCYNDIHFEFYANAIIPMQVNYEEDLYNAKETTPSFRIVNRDISSGFKIGFNIRSSIKSRSTYSAEYGQLPNFGTGNGSLMFINIIYGYNFNIGKTKHIVKE